MNKRDEYVCDDHDFKLVLRKRKQPIHDTVHSLQLQANRKLNLKLLFKAISCR